MNTPPTKFAIMRANRKKREHIAAYGRLLDAVSRNALGVQSQGLGLGSYTKIAAQQAVADMHPLLKDWKS